MTRVSTSYQTFLKLLLAPLLFVAVIPHAVSQEEQIQNKEVSFGPEPTPEEIKEEPSKISYNLSFAYRSKAQYFEEAQENYTIRGRVNYVYRKNHQFSLDQGVSYRNYPYEELYTSDTGLGYSYLKSLIDFPESTGLSLTPSAGVQLGTSKQSTAFDHRLGIINGSLDLSWQATDWLSVGTDVGADLFFYEETISIYGEATEKYATFIGFFAGLTFDPVTVSQSYRFYRTALNAGWEDIHTFSASSSVSVKLPSDYALSLSLVTSDNQLRYGRNDNFKMYDQDITRFTASVSKKFF